MNTSSSPHTNRLAKEKSPYLIQHQHNPVDWYAWGEEAFAKARREQKPIFLSIGYSTCHWCHVMAHESFENEEIAKLVNDNFIAIKVDREERPDVDRVYMTYVQAVTGGGGWPMTVFLTPDLQPFYGGTYFPPEDKFGRPGFPTVLKRLSEAWRDDRENVTKSAKGAIDQLRELSAGGPAKGSAGPAEIATAFNQLTRVFDDQWGGFGKAPKFPHPVTLNLLFRVYAREGAASEDGRAALGMSLATLDKMAAGGMHDHLGGGFHRYSVDRFWHIPHFEKMLYDQAQLVCSYLDAYQVTHEEKHAAVARDVLDYVLRDMTDQGGGFYSAEDADSIIAHGKPEHAEGAFYVWTKAEIDAALGTERAPIFNRSYGVEEKGNAPEGSDPHQEFIGKNTLIVRQSLAEAAKAAGQSEEAVAVTLAKCREVLLAMRAQRPRPHLDDKIITAWNGLMISAFAKAGQILGEPKYVTAAQRSAQFLKAQLWKEGRLIRNYRGEASNIAGFADDYASLIHGLLDLYEADFDVAWLRWAEELQKAMDSQFWDAEHGGYFSGQAGAADILLRMKEDYDGAEPSPNSVAALNLQRLAQILGSSELKARADQTIAAFSQRLAESPTGMPQMLCAVDSSLAKPRQIVIAGAPAAADTRALLQEVHRHYLPNKLLLLANGGEAQAWMAKHMEFLGTVQPIDGKAAAYVCENFTCQLPVTDPAKLRELLSK